MPLPIASLQCKFTEILIKQIKLTKGNRVKTNNESALEMDHVFNIATANDLMIASIEIPPKLNSISRELHEMQAREFAEFAEINCLGNGNSNYLSSA